MPSKKKSGRGKGGKKASKSKAPTSLLGDSQSSSPSQSLTGSGSGVFEHLTSLEKAVAAEQSAATNDTDASQQRGRPTRRQMKKMKAYMEMQKQAAERERVAEEAFEAKVKKEDEQIEKAPINWRRALWWVGIIGAVLVAISVLRMNQEIYSWSGLDRDDSSGETTSHYDLLEVQRTATVGDIKRSYRKLARKWHPDLNPNCGKECDSMIGKLNKAYETLSDPMRRDIYDQSYGGTVSDITSLSVELTYENFQEKVLKARGLVVIQVYAEWYKECQRFSTIWEDAHSRFGEYVTFGRIHATRQRSLVRRLGTAVRDFPTVMSYANGRFVRTYPAIQRPLELFDLIVEDFPKRHVWRATEQTLAYNIDRKHRHSKPPIDVLMVASQKMEPSLVLLDTAFKYEGIFQFAHVCPKSAVKAGLARNEHGGAVAKRSSGRVRFLSRALRDVFLLPEIKKLPQMMHIYPDGIAELRPEKVKTKKQLLSFVRGFAANRTIWLTSNTYTSVCQSEHYVVCLLFLKGCNYVGSDAAVLPKQVSTEKRREWEEVEEHLSIVSTAVIERFNLLREEFAPVWIQFANVDVTNAESTDLALLCPDTGANSNEFQFVAVREAATEGLAYYNILPEFEDDEVEEVKEDEGDDGVNEEESEELRQNEEYRKNVMKLNAKGLWKWVEAVLKRETIGPVIDVPNIRTPPPRRDTFVDDVLHYWEDFDWTDENFRLNVIIITVIIGGFFVLKNLGCRGFVMFVFVLSILGGGLQMLFSFKWGHPFDPRQSSARRGRGRSKR